MQNARAVCLVLQRLDARVVEPRIAAVDRVVRLAREFEVDARAALLRLSSEWGFPLLLSIVQSLESAALAYAVERQGMLIKPASAPKDGAAAAPAATASAEDGFEALMR